MFFKRNKNKVFETISGEELLTFLDKNIEELEYRIATNSYVFGPETLFTYQDVDHLIGAKYDTKTAKKKGEREFYRGYMTIYLDEQVFKTKDELIKYATIEGKKILEIPDGIIVAS